MDHSQDPRLQLVALADLLKGVERTNKVLDGRRRENSAEHSWHCALTAMLLADWSNEPIDSSRVIKMLLLHDLVEIEAGDVDPFAPAAPTDQHARELEAATRLFPGDVQTLWLEFDSGVTPEAHFARAIDKFMPLFLNAISQGKSWDNRDIPRSVYLAKKQSIQLGSQRLWQLSLQLIDEAVAKGWMINS